MISKEDLIRSFFCPTVFIVSTIDKKHPIESATITKFCTNEHGIESIKVRFRHTKNHLDMEIGNEYWRERTFFDLADAENYLVNQIVENRRRIVENQRKDLESVDSNFRGILATVKALKDCGNV